MIARAIVVLAVAGLLAVQVVRNATVARFAETNPLAVAKLWSGHPAVEISSAMRKIASAAHDRRAVPASTFSLLADAASKEPLAVEPFLVRGVQAQLAGDDVEAKKAFEAAQ